MSRMSGFPSAHPSFHQHRYQHGSLVLPLKIIPNTQLPPPVWGSLPTPPMSGTPPPDAHSEIPQLAGRRRKREDTPPASTTTEYPPHVSVGIPISPLVEQTGQRHGDHSRAGKMTDHMMMPAPLGGTWDHHGPYSTGGGGLGYEQFAPATFPLPGTTHVSPKTTRKTKPHVASACINCKKKHLKCDEARPCGRCVMGGKEDTCRDVEHKKRGRPPLKPDDHSSRTSRHSVNLPPLGSASHRIGAYAPTGYPPLLPQPSPMSMHYTPTYATPTLAQSSAVAYGQLTSPRQFHGYPQTHTHNDMPYTIPTATSPQYNFDYTSQSPGGQQYTGALFSRQQMQQQTHSEGPTGLYGTSSLQLPPILHGSSQNTHAAQMSHQRDAHLGHLSHGNMPPPMSYDHRRQHDSDDDDHGRSYKRPKMTIQGILDQRD